MQRSLLAAALVVIGLALANVGSAQEATPSAVEQRALTPEQQAEIAAAEANAALVATPGAWLGGAEPVYPEEERGLGHHGRAEVRGLLGVDGRLHHATIFRSSRSPGLDAAALASALADQYRPAQDANGNPIPVMFTTARAFYSFTSSEGVGAAMYTCPQFVRDMDWFKTTWDEQALHDHYFYLAIRGLGTIARMSTGAGIGAVESNEAYAARWDRAIETCRRRPEWRFAQAMRPEGDYIDGLARQQQQRSR